MGTLTYEIYRVLMAPSLPQYEEGKMFHIKLQSNSLATKNSDG